MVSDETGRLRSRKDEHLDVVLSGRVAGAGDAGFDAVRFEHVAAPERDLDSIDLTARFLGHTLAAPLMIGSMTGGPARAEAINRHLAEAASELGIAFAVGSQRVALETGADPGLDRKVRAAARGVPLLANVGGAQLRGPGASDFAARAVEAIAADAVIVHLNPLQEAVQAGGDRDWRGVLDGIGAVCRTSAVPVMVKEVGSGISGRLARRLADLGVAAVEVAGRGGTSWAAVEAERAASPADAAVARAFADWGIPTATAVAAVRASCPELAVVASGGIRDGVDAAKAVRLGADIAAQAAAVLPAAMTSTEAVVAHVEVLIRQLRIACFCTGSADLSALRTAPLLGE
jgi:isopentenyl-diphosphate delta-isomerase